MKQRRAARTLLAHAAALVLLALPLPSNSVPGSFLPTGISPAQAQANCVVQFVWRCATSQAGRACSMLLGTAGIAAKKAKRDYQIARLNCDKCRRERRLSCPGHRDYIMPAERGIDGRLRPVRPAPGGRPHREIQREAERMRQRAIGEIVGRAIGEALGGRSSRGSHYGSQPSFHRGSGHSGNRGSHGAHMPNERELERAIGRGIGNMFGGAARHR